jgi:hypothetical protein
LLFTPFLEYIKSNGRTIGGFVQKLLSLCLISLIITQEIIAESPSVHKARSYATQQLQHLKKIIACVRGDAGCSPEEITQARLFVGEISLGLGALVGGIGLWKWRNRSRVNSQKLEEVEPSATLYPRTDMRPIKALLQDNGYSITDKVMEYFTTHLKGDYGASQLTFNMLLNLTAKEELKFAHPIFDPTLWKFFKEQGVVPAHQKGRAGFYVWKGAERTGVARPNPEAPITIGDSPASIQIIHPQRGMED